MKILFYTGLAGLAIFEILKVYFIMPLPGSQEINSIDLAYFLHTSRWYFRILFFLMILGGSFNAFQTARKWIPASALLLVLIIGYFFNFKMTAEKMFREPTTLSFAGRSQKTLSDSAIVIAVEYEGEAKAYPVRYIIYHHQVRDTIGGKQVMITYCSVCRSGRAFEPVVNGKTENFRLVGMDHFNAMFEDETTGSWWQQATGQAVSGPLKGTLLEEVGTTQMTVNKFFMLHPFGKIMQNDPAARENYDSLGRFEKGKSKNDLTRTDSLSWKDKSWVVGLQVGAKTKAYDWNDLKRLGTINDKIGETPVVLTLSVDGQSFAAFERTSDGEIFINRNDTLKSDSGEYNFSGKSPQDQKLKRVNAYLEFWHSWKTFHSDTEVYNP